MKLNVPYKTLAFTLFSKCNAACSMCCFECSPQRIEKLDVARVKEYIDEAAEIDEITTISFTGGEPFLKYNLLLDLVKYAAATGKRVTTISNGFWATSKEIATERLAELKANGLQHLSTSHDFFHKEFIKTEYVANLLSAAGSLGVPSTLAIVKTKEQDIGSILDELGNSVYPTAIEIVPCLPAGGACRNFPSDSFDRTLASDTKGMRCIYSGNIVVGFDGNIYPCCSQVIFETGLVIGNYKELSLTEALVKVKKNGLLYLLRNRDLSLFSEFAKEKLGIDIPDKIVNPCELCALMFRKENLEEYKVFVIENMAALKK
ncbi:radical SAM protein [Pseudolactococcus yaeyamensis]